jgi:6-phosphofructokinase 1
VTTATGSAGGRKLAILTSGGDAPGMNAAIRAAAMVGIAAGWEVHGIEHGYRGLVDGELRRLGPADVGGIVREGGTILGSVRCKEFHERAVRDAARARLREADIEALLVIGGNGSLAGAAALADRAESGDAAPRVVGIPASIDNDIGLTGLAIDVDTAMNTIVEACDKISDTASAHDRVFIVEVMGRDCGYLAMTSAIASGADAVLFPEAERGEDQVVEALLRALARIRGRVGRTRRAIVVKAEGVGIPAARLKERIDAHFAAQAAAASGAGAGPGSATAAPAIETRVTVLGHLVRGGRPSAFDRLLASRLAHVAVRALLAGDTRKMAAWMLPFEPPPEVATRSGDDPYCWLVELAAVLSETEKLLARTSPLVRWRARVLGEIEEILAS